MSAELILVMAGVNYLAPGMGPGWLMVGSTSHDTETITNPNDFAVTITLANNWTDGRFTWNSPGNVTIPARGSSNQIVGFSGVAGANATATSAVSWSVAGGASGSVNAHAEHDSGA